MSAPVPAPPPAPVPPPVGGPPDDPGQSRSGDVIAGLAFVVLGAAFALTSFGYDLGTWRTMGPGMFPFVVGLVLVGLGVLVTLAGVAGRGELTAGVSRLPWRGLLCITGAVLLFAFGIEVLGFVLTVAATALVACLASATISIARAAAASAGITAACYVVFVLGLQLRLPLWP